MVSFVNMEQIAQCPGPVLASTHTIAEGRATAVQRLSKPSRILADNEWYSRVHMLVWVFIIKKYIPAP